jgi:hypothetical protein
LIALLVCWCAHANATDEQNMDKSLIYGPTINETMHARHSTYFSDKDNTVFGDEDEWHPVIKYIQIMFDLPVRANARTLWKKCSSLDEIKKITKYVSNAHVVLGLFDESGKGKTPVMTKSGLHMFLKSLPKETVSPKLLDIAEKNMAQFIAEGASCIANAGAKAASSAPMQQNGPPVQPPDAPPMQVLAVRALRMMCSCAT